MKNKHFGVRPLFLRHLAMLEQSRRSILASCEPTKTGPHWSVLLCSQSWSCQAYCCRDHMPRQVLMNSANISVDVFYCGNMVISNNCWRKPVPFSLVCQLWIVYVIQLQLNLIGALPPSSVRVLFILLSPLSQSMVKVECWISLQRCELH